MGPKKANKWQPCVTVFVFCALIFGFTAATIIQPSAEFSETENRVLAQKPEAETETVMNGEFEADYEEYLTDQFVLRDEWIGLKTSVERMLLKRESKDIYFAEDGYLIEKHTGTFTTDTASRNIAVLAQFMQEYKEKFGKGHLSVMIVPNAVEILQDKLPPFASVHGENEYLQRIADSLPGEVWFDAAQILRKHNTEELYYRTDHHWKTRAAFYVYREWAKDQGYDVPEITDYEIRTVTNSFEGTIQSKLGVKTEGDTIELFYPEKEISYTVSEGEAGKTKDSIYDYPALDTKDKYAVYFGGNQAFMKISTEADSGRKILIIKDSYANCFIPFMLGEFEEIDVLDIRYTSQPLSGQIAEGGYTDLLILYNAAGFAEDMNLAKLLN